MAASGMNVGVNSEGVFGNASFEQRLMPIAYIEKITLENNSVPPLQPDNPHIEDYTTSIIEGTNQVAYQKSAMQTTPDGCLVTVDIILKDTIENSALSSWFYDAELLKYMQVRIIQSTNKQMTTQLIKGKFAVLDNPANASHFHKKVINLQEYYETTKDFYSSAETGRGLVANIPYQTSFYLSNSQPSHLAYFVCCYFDIARLSQDYNLNMYGYNINQGVMSRDVTSEIVIDNGAVVSESYVFYTPEGEVWAGSAHQHNGVWMAGKKHTNAPHPMLTLEKIINTTVQDFRDIDAPFEKEINLKPIESLLSKLGGTGGDKKDQTFATNLREMGFRAGVIQKIISTNEVRIEDTTAYFSDALVARSETLGKPSAGIVFSFDIKKFLEQKSLFGKMLYSSANQAAKQKMFQLSKILSLKVYRYRATSQTSFNKIGSPVKGGTFKRLPFNGSENPPVLIINSHDERGVLKKTKNNIKGLARTGNAPLRGQTNQINGAIREINLRDSADIRTFAVSDFTIGEMTDGVYQYSVEVEVQDGTVTYLNDMLAKFALTNDDFSLYYDLCTSPEFYELNINQFKPEFFTYYIQKLNNNFSKAPWVRAPANFCHVLSVLTNMTPTQKAELYQYILTLCNPVTGSPKAILAILTQMKKLESITGSYLGNKKSVSIDRSGKSGSSQSFEKFILKDKQFFTHLLDSEIPDDYGLEFMDMGNRNKFSGPPTFTINDYNSRIIQENNKYFVSDALDIGSLEVSDMPDPAFTNLSSYGATYLTPVKAKNGVSTISTATQGGNLLSDMERYSNFSVPVLNRQMQKRGNAISIVAAPPQINHERVSFLGQLGISVSSIYDTNTDEPSKLLRGRDVLGLDSSFSTEDIEYSNFPEAMTEVDLQQLVGVFSSDLTLMQDERLFSDAHFTTNSAVEQVEIGCFNVSTSACNITDNYILPDDSYDVANAAAIPNQIKSLFLSSRTDTVKINWFEKNYDVANNPTTALMFVWNYQNIAKVEYLETYQTTLHEGKQVNAPVWKPLTFAALSTLQAITGIVLCRLVKYDDAINKIGYSMFAQMPYYNSCFLLASSQRIASSGNITSASQVIVDTSYKQMINFGSKMSQLVAQVNSSAYVSSVVGQQQPQNPESGYYDPLEESGYMENSVDVLLNEMSGLCELGVPAPEGGSETEEGVGGGEGTEEGGTTASTTVEVEESDLAEDDTFSFDPDGTESAPSDTSSDPAETVDYHTAVNDAIDKIVEDQIEKLGDGSTKMRDLIRQWVDATIGANFENHSSGDTPGTGGASPSGDDNGSTDMGTPPIKY